MSIQIGIIGDVHASPEPLTQALAIFESEQVTDIICTGDIAGYFEELPACVQLLKQYRCKTVIGNHDQSWLESNSERQDSDIYAYLNALPEKLEMTFEDKSLYIVHAHPPLSQHGGIKLLDIDGQIIHENKQAWTKELEGFAHDILIVGHTHQVFAEQLGSVLVVNPGSTAFNHSCMILTLPEMTTRIFALENQNIVKCWNFSMLFNQHDRYPTSKKPS